MKKAASIGGIYFAIFFATMCVFGQNPNPKAVLLPGTFHVEVSGGIDMKWEGKAHAFLSGKDWGIQLVKQEKATTAVTSVLIMLPGVIKTGSSKIVAYEKAYGTSGKVIAVGAVFSGPNIAGTNAEGTLTLSSAGPEFTGDFEFTAQSGFDRSQKFLVKGAFNKLVVETSN